jgi:hypothetical protein
MAATNDRPVLSSKRALHVDELVAVMNEPQMEHDTKTD